MQSVLWYSVYVTSLACKNNRIFPILVLALPLLLVYVFDLHFILLAGEIARISQDLQDTNAKITILEENMRRRPADASEEMNAKVVAMREEIDGMRKDFIEAKQNTAGHLVRAHYAGAEVGVEAVRSARWQLLNNPWSASQMRWMLSANRAGVSLTKTKASRTGMNASRTRMSISRKW